MWENVKLPSRVSSAEELWLEEVRMAWVDGGRVAGLGRRVDGGIVRVSEVEETKGRRSER